MLKPMNPYQLRLVYETDLREAFPPAELKPFPAMREMMARGVYEALAFYGGEEEPLGYVLLWKHVDGRFILIDYLCVPARRRNKGIGGRILAELFAAFPPETVFIGESEAPTGDPAADGLILRRLDFYRRSGAALLSYDSALFGVRFKTIAWSREKLPPEGEILAKHQEIYLERFIGNRHRQMIQIPLHPGERPAERRDWTED